MAQLDKLKALLGITDDSKDGALNVYLDFAKEKMLNRLYPFVEDVSTLDIPARYLNLQVEIALYMWDKRGAEGQTSHNENGISRTYESADIPESLLNHLTPFVGVLGNITTSLDTQGDENENSNP